MSGVAALGNFDGVHRGHQALLHRAIDRARERSVPALVVTFRPHPGKVLAPQLAPRLLLTYDERAAELRARGVDRVVEIPFTADFAKTTPRAFVDEILVGQLNLSGVVVGSDFTFGHKAAGKVHDLAALLHRHGRTVDVLEPVKVDGLICSSTRIRELVLEGRVEGAAQMLGRPYSVIGEVVRGDGRGRQIGVPTANVANEREVLPKLGVYATTTVVDGKRFPSVTNVGLRPTFQGEGVRIEAHLLDASMDLYGHRIAVEFVTRIRDEQRFPSIDSLVAQIRRDIDAARQVLTHSVSPGR